MRQRILPKNFVDNVMQQRISSKYFGDKVMKSCASKEKPSIRWGVGPTSGLQRLTFLIYM